MVCACNASALPGVGQPDCCGAQKIKNCLSLSWIEGVVRRGEPRAELLVDALDQLTSGAGEVHDYPASVVGVRFAAHPTTPFEPIEELGDRCGGDLQTPSEIGRCVGALYIQMTKSNDVGDGHTADVHGTPAAICVDAANQLAHGQGKFQIRIGHDR